MQSAQLVGLADGILEDLWFGESDPKRSELQASTSLAAAVGRATGLKPFPVVAQQVMAMVSSPSAEPRALARVIATDPALSSSFMRIANSAMYRRIAACTNVFDAVVRLGMVAARDIAVGLTTMGLFADSKGTGLRVRNHSVTTASFCRVLADEWRLRSADQAMLAGLLHDVGRLLLVQTGEDVYDVAPPDARDRPDTLHLYERELAGFDHAVLGAHVLRHWRIPDPIPQIVALHHQPGRAYEIGGTVGLTVAILRLADRIEYQWRAAGGLDEVFCESAMRSSEASYLGFRSDDLMALQPALAAAAADSDKLLL